MSAGVAAFEKDLVIEGPKKEESLTGLSPLVDGLPGVSFRDKVLGSSYSSYLYKRSTYYWIAVIVNFCQLCLCALGLKFAVAVKEYNKHDTKSGYMGNMFVASGIYSLALFCASIVAIYVHYRKGDDPRFNAGMHYSTAKFQTILSCFTLLMLFSLGPTFFPKTQPCPDYVRPTIYPILVGLATMGTVTNIMAAYITYQSAKRGKGTEMVSDPNHRLPAWMLASTDESPGVLERPIQL